MRILLCLTASVAVALVVPNGGHAAVARAACSHHHRHRAPLLTAIGSKLQDPPVVAPEEWPLPPSSLPSPPASTSPMFMLLPLKWVVLVLLVVQNSATTLLITHTRSGVSAAPGPLYLGGAAVLVSELMKLVACLALLVREEGGVRGMLAELDRAILSRWRDTLRMSVPALSYGLQNALLFVALSNLSATSYQLWSQSKTLFTALFFVTILGKVLRAHQWVALAVLTAGVGLVQVADAAGAAAAGTATGAAAAVGGGVVAVGVAAVLASSLLSGFANIYLEKLLKQAECEADDTCDVDGARIAPMSLWTRNVQLSVFAIPQAVALLLLSAHARATIGAHGLLAGFTPAVWGVTLLTAGGGLLVAAVVKHADNVLKTYATAVAIVVTCLATAVSSRVLPSAGFLRGMALVIGSMFLYNDSFGLFRRKGAAAA
mgnify:CR=1 FL=1|tara:strand:+ start:283 stop:1575 length:1293 start_codon:yes stop_codon:yes gene_type:complete